MKNCLLNPLSDYVLVELLPAKEVSDGGILLPQAKTNNNQRKKTEEGIIAAVGPGKLNKEGNRVPVTLKVNEKVIMNFGGTDIEHNGMKYRLIKEDDILAVLDTNNEEN